MPAVIAGMLVVLVVPLLSVPLCQVFCKITVAVGLAVLVYVQVTGPAAMAAKSSVTVFLTVLCPSVPDKAAPLLQDTTVL